MDLKPPINQGAPAATPGALPPNQPTPPAHKSSGLLSPSGLYNSHKDENLVDSVTVVERNVRMSFWKLLLLDGLVVIAAALLGYVSLQYLAGALSAWFVFGGFLCWSAASTLVGFLQKRIAHRILVAIIESVALVGFFYSYPLQVLILVAFLVFWFMMWGYFSIRRELRNAIRIRFFTASSGIIGKIATATLILLISLYAVIALSRGDFFIPQNYFDGFFNWSSGFVGNFYPNVPLNGSFGDFAQAVAANQLQSNAAFQALPSAEQSQALAQAVAQITAGFTPTPSPTEPTRDVFYAYVISFATKLQNQFGNGFILVWMLVLFLILRSIGIIAVWIAQFFTLIFYEFFLAIGFMAIREETEPRETLDIT